MDNSNQAPQDDQVVGSTPVAPVQDDGQSQAVSGDQTQQASAQSPTVSTPPIAPSGSMHKEAGPVAPAPEYQMMPSSPSETRPVLDQEVQEAGVERSVDPTELQLNEEHSQAGIQPAKESIPVLQSLPVTATAQVKNAPFTPLEATEILKTTPTDDTKHWLAVLLLMLYKKAQLIASGSQTEQERKVA